MQELLRKKDKKLAISFNFTFRYIDDVLSQMISGYVPYVITTIPFPFMNVTYHRIRLFTGFVIT